MHFLPIGDPATEGNLHISPVELSDDALYQCKLGIFGDASNAAYLTVQGKHHRPPPSLPLPNPTPLPSSL